VNLCAPWVWSRFEVAQAVAKGCNRALPRFFGEKRSVVAKIIG
jgi:hypothetical protein